MKRLSLAACLAIAVSVPALAKDAVSKEDADKVLAAIKLMNCEADAKNIERDKSGGYEVDDASCKIGQYDIKLTKDFKVQSIKRD